VKLGERIGEREDINNKVRGDCEERSGWREEKAVL